MLEDDEARRWLLAQPWEDTLPRIGGSDLLYHALTAEFTAGEPVGTNGFLATLPAAEESYVTSLLAERPYPHPLNVAQDCWHGLEKRIVREALTTLEGRLRLGDASPEETAQVQKEILDLRERLKQIARL